MKLLLPANEVLGGLVSAAVAGLAHLTLAGEYLHAPVRAGMEDVWA